MACFRSTLTDCMLGDLGFKGSKYTWGNRRDPDCFFKERLDMTLSSEGWCDRFPNVAVGVLATRTSEHNPLWIRFHPNLHATRRPRLFHFEACWNLDEECAEVIKASWARGVEGGCSLATTHLHL